MICVNQKYIQDELSRDVQNGWVYRHLKLSNRLIERLLRQYFVVGLVENFYDSEPEFDEELYGMYLDYQEQILGTDLLFVDVGKKRCDVRESYRFSKQEHSIEELRQAYVQVEQTYVDYEEKRLSFCNWQEPYFEGNWDMSQSYVDGYAYFVLKQVQKLNVSKQHRFYWAKQEDEIRIYMYTRDVQKCDYWMFLKRRERPVRYKDFK